MRTVLTAIVFGFALPAHALEHPELLEEQPGCENWLGSCSGNDPSVRLNVRLCRDEAGAVTGQAQWSSLLSGWNVRELSGRWDGHHLVMRDVRIVEERAENGFYFCTIDRWDLTRTGDQLRGHYVSAACRDRATVRLSRVAGEDAPSSPGEPSGETGDPTVTPAPAPGPTPGPDDPAPGPSPVPPADPPDADTPDAGCGACTAAGMGGSAPALLLLAALALVCRIRRWRLPLVSFNRGPRRLGTGRLRRDDRMR